MLTSIQVQHARRQKFGNSEKKFITPKLIPPKFPNFVSNSVIKWNRFLVLKGRAETDENMVEKIKVWTAVGQKNSRTALR
jgi:hypothetical protein